jgi:serine/threonine-protein kinase
MTLLEAFIGRTVGGRFSITALLGEGAMGVVFRGAEAGRSEGVAIKILHPDIAVDPSARARFLREAEMAAQIDHPNAVRVLAHGVEDGLHYLVMELVEGRELFEVLARAGRLPAARAAAIALQICDAVATAHDHGIIHRDLKPENVMLVGDPAGPGGERVKLLDFGIAKQLRGDGDGQITLAGTIMGTPAYMSPEQCEGGVVDARSDVYACGAVLYHLVTGRSPFEDESPLRMLCRHVTEEPVPPCLLVPDLDRGLSTIILKALAKRPEHRHQGAHELWEELLAALPRLSQGGIVRAPASARVAAPARPSMVPAPALAAGPGQAHARRGSHPASRARMLLVAGVAGLVLAVGVVGALGSAQARPAPEGDPLPSGGIAAGR